MHIVSGSKFINRLKFFRNKIKRRFSKRPEIEIFDFFIEKHSFSINKIFVINLDRQRSRWKKLEGEAKSQKVKNGYTLLDFMERISAVDGRLISADDFSSLEVEKLYTLKQHFFIDPDPSDLPP